MFRYILFALFIFPLTACDSISYYAQAVHGQAAILLARQPISRLVQDPSLDPELRERLLLVEAARDFAEKELGLSAAGSFTSFVDPGRQHLVWNVFAAPWNSTELINWCFPVAGCVSYRGYFSERAARRYAAGLSAQGYDVYVGGVDAYSTLGWFKDPLPATVLRRSDIQLAGLVFHELAHQRFYLPGDTRFNESFASFVEQQGLQLWLERRGQEEQFAGVGASMTAQQGFADFVISYREQLRVLYASTESDAVPREQIREQKQMLFDQMRDDWMQREDARNYAGWFAGELNNAMLATVGTYFDWVPAFEQLYIENLHDFESFYRAVYSLAALSPQNRVAELERLQSVRLQRSLLSPVTAGL